MNRVYKKKMNHFDFLNKEMLREDDYMDLSPFNNTLLLLNLLFYSTDLRNSYNYLYDDRYKFDFTFDNDQWIEHLNKFLVMFKELENNKINYEDYIKIVISNAFNVDINLVNFKVFNEQIKDIFNLFLNLGEGYFSTGYYEPYYKENMFIFSVVNGIMRLIRRGIHDKDKRRKFQTKIIELYYLKFGFDLKHTFSDEEENFYNKNIIYHLHILSRFLLKETNYNNNQVQALIKFTNDFFSNSTYFERNLWRCYREFYKLYFQSVYLLSLNFSDIDYFNLITNIYSITPKFINVFKDIFPKERVERINQSNFKFLDDLKYMDLKEHLYLEEQELITVDEWNNDYSLIDIQDIDKRLFYITNKKIRLYNSLIRNYFKSDKFSLYNTENNEIILSALNDQKEINEELNKINNEINQLVHKFEGDKKYYYLSSLDRINYINERDINKIFQLEFIRTIDDIVNKINTVVVEKILFGDLNDKLKDYEKESSKLNEIIKIGNIAENELLFFKGEIEKEALVINDKCPICGSDLTIRSSKYGHFYACSDFPKCAYIKGIEAEENLQRKIYEKNKTIIILDKLKKLAGIVEDEENIEKDSENISVVTTFDYLESKIDVINYLYFDISKSNYYSNLKRLNRIELEEKIDRLNTNKLYDWTYTLGLSKYLLDYYEVNQEKLFSDKSSIDWTFIYVLLTKSLENLIASFIEYKVKVEEKKSYLKIKKYNQLITLNFNNERWREGLTINDFRYIVEKYLSNNGFKFSNLSNKIKVLLQDDRNKYLHHNSLIGFNNLKNVYFIKIFELIYFVLTEV